MKMYIGTKKVNYLYLGQTRLSASVVLKSIVDYFETLTELALSFEKNDNDTWTIISADPTKIPEIAYIPKYHKGLIVSKVSKDAFADCTNMKKITFPNTILSIDVDAFTNCTNLTNIELPASLKNIVGQNYYNCNFTNIPIRTTVSDINAVFNWYTNDLH